MSKLKEKLSKWFLDTAKKLDNQTVDNETTVVHQLPPQLMNITRYDRNHVDIVRGQYSASTRERMEASMFHNFDYEKEIYYRIAQGIAEEIMKNYGDQIKVEHRSDLDADVYSLEIFVCKPQKERERW